MKEGRSQRRERRVQRYKIALLALLSAASCLLIYYFHVIRGLDVLVAHALYVPAILAVLWHRWPGLVVAALLAACLVLTSQGAPGLAGVAGNDYIRAFSLLGVAGVVAFLSERRYKGRLAIERMQSEKERILDTLVEHVVYQDREMKIRWANRAACDSAGLARAEIVGRRCHELWGRSDEPCADCPVVQAMTTGRPQDVERSTPDGQVWFVRGYPITDEDGNVTGGVDFALNITERKRAEEGIRRFKTISDKANYGAAISDLQGNLTYVNETFARMHGYSPPELIGQALSMFHTDEQMVHVNRLLDRLREQDGFTAEEVWHKHKDGSVFPTLMNATVVAGAAGEPLLFSATAVDISEYKRAEEALRQSEERFRELADLLPQTVFEMDTEGNFTYANRAGLEAFGYAQQDVEGLNVLQVFVPEDRERVAHNIRNGLAGDELADHEHLALRKDGSTFPVLLYSAAIMRGDRPVGLRGIVLDITERKEVEKALRTSERNYREIFNAANEAILVHDGETGAILDVNQTMLVMFGCSYEEALTCDLAGLGLGESGYSEAERCARIMEAGEAGPQVFEWRCRRKDGELFWAEVNLKSAVIGGQRRVLAVVRDITDRKCAEAEAQQHQTELTRAWHANALGEMASGLAHELNQPLCAILNYSNSCLRMARRKRFSVSVMSSSIEQIADQAERAAGVIKHMRSLVAKRDPHRTEIEINGVLNNALHMIQVEIASRNVVVVTRLADDLPKITADRVEIAQVVLNLMRNAIEAMSGPDVTERTLTISTARVAEDRIQVTVADSGHGFPSELSEKIFDSFFTTKNQGLGVGLSLSRRIVEAHGGRLWAESDGCSGATFRFTLPAEGASHGQRSPRSLCGG